MANVVDPAPIVQNPWSCQLQSDFTEDINSSFWTATTTDSGTVAVGDAANGIVVLTPSDSSVADNDEAYLASPNEVYLPAVGRALHFGAFIQFTEAATNAANIAVGFASAVGANLILDNGAGLRTSGSIFSIYKVDGETAWRCVSRNGSTANVSLSTTTAGGSAYQELVIRITDQGDLGYQTIAYFVNGAPLVDSTTGLIIAHTLTVSGATEMQAFLGVKNGSATLETLNCDYLGAAQTR